jgi:hypothetical protein
MKTPIKLIEVLLDDSEDALQSASLVENPAVQVKWMAFEEEEDKQELFFEDEDQQILVGPAMIPDKKIPRLDEKTKEPYLVYFSKDTVAKAAANFLRFDKASKQNTGHKNNFTKDIYALESWLIENKYDKAYTQYGFSTKRIPVGTWMLKMKVEDPKIWSDVKEGRLNGFSVQGRMIMGPETMTMDFTSKVIKKKYSKLYEGLSESEVKDLDVILAGIEAKETGYYETPEEAKKFAKKIGLETIHAFYDDRLEMTLYAPGKTKKEYEKAKVAYDLDIKTPDYTKEGATGPVSSMEFTKK